MSRLKLERYYEGFVRRGDVGTAIICRSCWDNAERGHRGEIQGEGRYGNEGRNPSLFNGMLPHSFAIILTILIMCLPSGTRRPVSLSPVLEPVAHLAAGMINWTKGLDQCTQKIEFYETAIADLQEGDEPSINLKSALSSTDSTKATLNPFCDTDFEAGFSGSGVDSSERWFYNSKVGDCEIFTYLGYGGNENNYRGYFLLNMYIVGIGYL